MVDRSGRTTGTPGDGSLRSLDVDVGALAEGIGLKPSAPGSSGLGVGDGMGSPWFVGFSFSGSAIRTMFGSTPRPSGATAFAALASAVDMPLLKISPTGVSGGRRPNTSDALAVLFNEAGGRSQSVVESWPIAQRQGRRPKSGTTGRGFSGCHRHQDKTVRRASVCRIELSAFTRKPGTSSSASGSTLKPGTKGLKLNMAPLENPAMGALLLSDCIAGSA